MQQPVEFSQYRKEKSVLGVESSFVYILSTAHHPLKL